MYGHTHVKEIASRDGVLFVNPGSVSLPKDGSNSYAVYESRAMCTQAPLPRAHRPARS
ncbi:metallophosphoesterase family protein [Ellagibacter isourolithinifaciens]|uniref:metallophosphoesterase family protein n=1 Tax=Ellagibacter isourolithinifaciens TaxID=2137581 RepID=UPI003A8E9CD2